MQSCFTVILQKWTKHDTWYKCAKLGVFKPAALSQRQNWCFNLLTIIKQPSWKVANAQFNWGAMSAGCVKRFRTLKTKELYLGASEACFAKLHTQGAAKGNTQHSWQAPLNALFFPRSALSVPQHTGALTRTEEVSEYMQPVWLLGSLAFGRRRRCFPARLVWSFFARTLLMLDCTIQSEPQMSPVVVTVNVTE